jgi:hypothetical protein
MKGKSIEITLKSTQPDEASLGNQETDNLLNYLVQTGELMGHNTGDSSFKIDVESLQDPNAFFQTVIQRMEDAGVKDVKVVLKMKLIK